MGRLTNPGRGAVRRKPAASGTIVLRESLLDRPTWAGRHVAQGSRARASHAGPLRLLRRSAAILPLGGRWRAARGLPLTLHILVDRGC